MARRRLVTSRRGIASMDLSPSRQHSNHQGHEQSRCHTSSQGDAHADCSVLPTVANQNTVGPRFALSARCPIRTTRSTAGREEKTGNNYPHQYRSRRLQFDPPFPNFRPVLNLAMFVGRISQLLLVPGIRISQGRSKANSSRRGSSLPVETGRLQRQVR